VTRLPEKAERYEDMDKIVGMYVKRQGPTEIARQTGFKRAYVVEILDEWKASARHMDEMRDRVAEAIRIMEEHFNFLVREGHKTLSQVDEEIGNNGIDHQLLSQRTKASAFLLDLEQKKIDTLQKAGLLDAAEVGDQVAEMERRQGIIVDILRNELCPACRQKVMRRLGEVTNKTEVVVVHEQ